MSGSTIKHAKLKEAIAKAGTPSAAEIPAKKRPILDKGSNKFHKVPVAGTPSEKPGSSVQIKSARSPITKATKDPKLEAELKQARRQKRELERQVLVLQGQFKEQKAKADRAKRKAEDSDRVFIELRKVLGAGRDAKAEGIPNRVSVRFAELEAEVDSATTQLQGLRGRIETLDREVLRKDQEILRLQRELEPILLNADGPKRTPASILGRENDELMGDVETESEEEVIPSLFSMLTSKGDLDGIAGRYCAWVLGTGAFKGSRSNRMKVGLNPAWQLADLWPRGPVSLEGEQGFRIEVRSTEDAWLMRFDHCDGRFAGTTWSNVVRLKRGSGGGTYIEHAVIRSTGAHSRRPDPPGIPKVLRDLQKESLDLHPWSDFRRDAHWVREDAVETFVSEVLLNPQRDLPVVYISNAASADGPLVDPDELAKKLDGLAVVFLQAFSNKFMLSEALQEKGLDRKLSCFDGGVRLFLPGLCQESDPYKHPLLLRSSLEGKPAVIRLKIITTAVTASTVGSRVPPNFGRIIEDFDTQVKRSRASDLAASGNADEKARAYEDLIHSLETELARSRAEAEVIPDLRERINEARARADDEAAYSKQIGREYEELRQERANLAAQLEILKQRTPREPEEVDTKDLLTGLILDRWGTIGGMVRQFQAAFPDRLEVLDSALSSAESCSFQKPDIALKLLRKLITDYYEALCEGKGDLEAAKTFGPNTWAPDESDNLSPKGRQARTFQRGDEHIYMGSHLKHTDSNSRSSNAVLRIHYCWDPSERKIVLGHIGEHLPL